MKNIFLTISVLLAALAFSVSTWAESVNPGTEPNEAMKRDGARATSLMADPENCCYAHQPSKPALLGDDTNSRPEVIPLTDKPADNKNNSQGQDATQ